MRILTALLIFSLLIILTGCNNQSTAPVVENTANFGEYEIPADLQALLTQVVPSEDKIVAEATNMVWDEALSYQVNNCDIYSVTMLWGDLFNYSGATLNDTTDWSGTLTASSNGFVRRVYEIDFEDGQDYIVPYSTPNTLGWVSFTSVDFDGIHCLVYLPRGPVMTAITAIPFITIQTEHYTFRFNSVELARLDYFYQVDNQNAVLIHSRRLWTNTCPGGYLDGTWIKEGGLGNSYGRFEGNWRDHNGELIGLMYGSFWADSLSYDANYYHYGRWSGWVTHPVLAVILVEMEGYWFFDDPRMCPMCGEGHGVFYGTFQDQMGSDRTGKIFGEFGDYSLPPNDVEMPYNGIWQYDCPIVSLTNIGP